MMLEAISYKQLSTSAWMLLCHQQCLLNIFAFSFTSDDNATTHDEKPEVVSGSTGPRY